VPENARFVTVYAYAQLVHEATHGLMHKKWFYYNKSTKPRIEGLCRKEEMRFSARPRLHDEKKYHAFRA